MARWGDSPIERRSPFPQKQRPNVHQVEQRTQTRKGNQGTKEEHASNAILEAGDRQVHLEVEPASKDADEASKENMSKEQGLVAAREQNISAIILRLLR